MEHKKPNLSIVLHAAFQPYEIILSLEASRELLSEKTLAIDCSCWQHPDSNSDSPEDTNMRSHTDTTKMPYTHPEREIL